MLTWRGKILGYEQLLGSNLRLRTIELRVHFEIYETAAPAVVLRALEEFWRYPLRRFQGLTGIQVRQLILNVGLVNADPVDEQPEGRPPALRTRGAEVLEDFRQSQRVLEAPADHPYRNFGP